MYQDSRLHTSPVWREIRGRQTFGLSIILFLGYKSLLIIGFEPFLARPILFIEFTEALIYLLLTRAGDNGLIYLTLVKCNVSHALAEIKTGLIVTLIWLGLLAISYIGQSSVWSDFTCESKVSVMDFNRVIYHSVNAVMD